MDIKKKLNDLMKESLGSYRYSAIDGEAPIDKASVKKIPKDKKKYIAELWDGTKIFMVNGEWVRNNIDVSWIGGSHESECGWIPKKEIWIEEQKSSMDAIFYLFHEIIESVQMKYFKQPYEKSHDISNSVENVCRKMYNHVKGKDLK